MGMFAVGLSGQPRRVVHYDHMFAVGNFVSTMGAYTIGLGMLLLLYAVISSWRHGPVAPANPWGGKTLEWAVPNPIPLENFEVLPVVIADPYGYGEGDPTSPPVQKELQPVGTSVGATAVTASASAQGDEGQS
jgi:cytochrome c oxidase subunit I